MKIKINFDNVYRPLTISSDFSTMTFYSTQKNGSDELIFVKIAPLDHPNMPDVFNLGFGPLKGINSFHDDVRLKHADTDKVFSTVLLLFLLA